MKNASVEVQTITMNNGIGFSRTQDGKESDRGACVKFKLEWGPQTSIGLSGFEGDCEVVISVHPKFRQGNLEAAARYFLSVALRDLATAADEGAMSSDDAKAVLELKE